jgi:hypothetical protein
MTKGQTCREGVSLEFGEERSLWSGPEQSGSEGK